MVAMVLAKAGMSMFCPSYTARLTARDLSLKDSIIFFRRAVT